jgi:hypothetical protein
MADFDSFPPTQTNSLSATGSDPAANGGVAPQPQYDDRFLLDLFERYKKDAFNSRWIWEREWLRDIYYVTNRQWIYYHPTRREWIDKRLAKNVPRPVTNKVAEVLQSLRSSFGSVDLGVVAQPVGHNPESVATSEIIEQLAPLIHEEHRMNQVMREADFWFIVTGNACLQVSWDTDVRFNRVFIPYEACMNCGLTLSPAEILSAQNICPQCGSTQWIQGQNPDGTPAGVWQSYGRGKTTALSPFEYALPSNCTRFDETPFVIRLRWRDKHYYEANHPELLNRIVWEQSPSDRSLQIYKSLALVNDMGSSGNAANLSSTPGSQADGVTEYELWLRPTKQFPEGYVMRVVGEKSPMIVQCPEEGIPGPIPYKDRAGLPLFPFSHAPFEQIGGRLYGRSALSPIIQKQDQLNQLDSLIQMIVQRMANPVWIVPENAGIDQFTGDPGLVVKWNPLAAGGNAKPERVPGENVPPTLYTLREQYLRDIEDLAGTYDIMKGNKPAGVEAFSALQLLVEKSQARFTSAFKARGEMYRAWFATALELERSFGPETRIMSVVSPNKGYTFKQFEKAQLQGNVEIHIEDGTDTPKTALGKRAAIEHANQLHLLDPNDPDQKYAILSQLGLSDLVPSLDVHVQTALQIQDDFERWAHNPNDPQTGMPLPMPLVIKPWHDPKIHWGERIKWLNTDNMKEILRARPDLEPIIQMHVQELANMIAMMNMPAGPMPGPGGMPPPPGGQGAGRAMSNSNTNSGAAANANGPAGGPK